MVGDRGPWSVSRAQPGNGLAVRGRARLTARKPADRAAVARSDRGWACGAVAAVLLAVVALGLVIDHAMLIRLAAIVLIAWAAWHALYGHRGRVRVGMQTGLLGLVLWSFLMASGHGAGLILIPALQPICAAAGPPAEATPGSPLTL